ncbi:MAG: FmdB family transcriptional regulator [Nocardiopsaceae bacterium]|nr:FmdB family transcriptional regulator [Nocardiopsaceae bacterium]
MPTYQYACTTCGEQVEAVQRFDDEPLSVCSACGGSLRKVFSPVGIVFKGSGFYRTDSRKAAKAEDSGAKAAKSNGSSGSAEGKSGDKKDSASSDGKKSAASKASKPAGAKSGS